MRHSLLALAALASLATSPAAQSEPERLEFLTSRTDRWTIVVPDAATPQENEAAGQLSQLAYDMTGIRLEILPEAWGPASDRILVGNTNAGLALAPSLRIDQAGLGQDGFAIRAAGDELVLLAGLPDGSPTEPLGIVYAVNHLLETELGVRFWAPDALQVPSRATLSVPADLSLTVSPSIWFRQVNYGPANDPAYRRWHKLDRVQEETGRLWAPRWVHSAFHHVDPGEHFDAHPEYFSLVGDSRTPMQLCLTNPDVLELVSASFARAIDANPRVRYISFSQEDNHGACTCGPCAAIDEREGTQMGALLTFVNQLAERFPERIVSTLAYQYSRKPPAELEPRSNVSIMLCTIEEDRARPIFENPGSSFPADLAGWTAIADDIFLWDYEVQFASPVAPFPNLRTLGPNVRWFADAGVRHVFLQGNGLRTELAELRCYLLAKLAWDPDTDVEATTAEFLAGFYGAAAPHLAAYIELLHDEVETSGEELVLYGNPALAADSWLRDEVRAAAREHLAAAAKAVAEDSVLSKRVRTASLPMMYADLEVAKRRGLEPGGLWTEGADGPVPRPQLRGLVEDFLAGCEAAGIDRLREYDLSPAVYRQTWEVLLDPALPRHAAFGAAVSATPPPSTKYAGGQVARLTDGLPGAAPGSAPVTRAFQENWLGWEGTDAVITVELDVPLGAGPHELGLRALQEPRSWVWLPESIQVEVRQRSPEGSAWVSIGTLTHEHGDRDPLVRGYGLDFSSPAEVDAVRLTVDAGETCPGWHIGTGGPSWFFLDELRID